MKKNNNTSLKATTGRLGLRKTEKWALGIISKSWHKLEREWEQLTPIWFRRWQLGIYPKTTLAGGVPLSSKEGLVLSLGSTPAGDRVPRERTRELPGRRGTVTPWNFQGQRPFYLHVWSFPGFWLPGITCGRNTRTVRVRSRSFMVLRK